LETAAASTEEVASVEVDSGTAAASAEDTASVEVDSAVLMVALAANGMRKSPKNTRLVSSVSRSSHDAVRICYDCMGTQNRFSPACWPQLLERRIRHHRERTQRMILGHPLYQGAAKNGLYAPLIRRRGVEQI
jgi:hypothetical protein